MTLLNPLAFNLQSARRLGDSALVVHCRAMGLRFTWLRLQMRDLAVEVRDNVNALRLVSSHHIQRPNPVRWGLTIAFLLVVSPRRGMYLLRLAKSYAELGFFRTSGQQALIVSFAFGVALGLFYHLGVR